MLLLFIKIKLGIKFYLRTKIGIFSITNNSKWRRTFKINNAFKWLMFTNVINNNISELFLYLLFDYNILLSGCQVCDGTFNGHAIVMTSREEQQSIC